MKSSHYAFAAALTAGIVYSVITLALTYAREASLAFLAHVHFMHSFGAAQELVAPSLQLFASGLAQIMVYSYLITLLFCVIASKMCGSCCSSASTPASKSGCCK